MQLGWRIGLTHQALHSSTFVAALERQHELADGVMQAFIMASLKCLFGLDVITVHGLGLEELAGLDQHVILQLTVSKYFSICVSNHAFGELRFQLVVSYSIMICRCSLFLPFSERFLPYCNPWFQRGSCWLSRREAEDPHGCSLVNAFHAADQLEHRQESCNQNIIESLNDGGLHLDLYAPCTLGHATGHLVVSLTKWLFQTIWATKAQGFSVPIIHQRNGLQCRVFLWALVFSCFGQLIGVYLVLISLRYATIAMDHFSGSVSLLANVTSHPLNLSLPFSIVAAVRPATCSAWLKILMLSSLKRFKSNAMALLVWGWLQCTFYVPSDRVCNGCGL